VLIHEFEACGVLTLQAFVKVPEYFRIRGLSMRLDKYLKVSRLIKRRSVANEACDAGRVQINGRPAKAGTEVKVGDHLTIQFGNKDVNVEVLDVQETVHKENAGELYKYI
jgi:ribosomal 50S subunit-recycling heat shock protein